LKAHLFSVPFSLPLPPEFSQPVPTHSKAVKTEGYHSEARVGFRQIRGESFDDTNKKGGAQLRSAFQN
jgi:hypothetical protein